MSQSFTAKLVAYKQAIDEDIASYAAHIQASTKEQYGEYAALETSMFLEILSRGGKRIRGALVVVGYEMSGGKNRAMILQAARAIEMLHAYVLILDDIQDRSLLRRGKPTAHELFAKYHHEHHLRGDPTHFGISVAMNAALAGAHAAETILANLDADPELRLKVLSIVNRTLAITAHGQTCDMMNSLVPNPSEADIERVLEWKTALYSFINPLHVGMVLADADCHATDAITPFARETGKAFQITDDIMGIFGDEKALGKTTGEDIREGKATMLMQYTLAHAPSPDATFLRSHLGAAKLTARDLARCKEIVEKSGARSYAQAVAEQHAAAALKALDVERARWQAEDVDFLRQLATSVGARSV